MLDLEGIFIKFQLQIGHRTDALDRSWISLVCAELSSTVSPRGLAGNMFWPGWPWKGMAFSVQFTHTMSLELSFGESEEKLTGS